MTGSFYGSAPNYATNYPTQNDDNAQPTNGNTAAPSSFYPNGGAYQQADPQAALNSANAAAASAAAAATSAANAAAAVQASAGTANPNIDGTAAPGTSTLWAHQDHVHPTDNSRAAANYTAPFTNAVARTVIARLADTVSVKDFGAHGDGATDDTSAIQAAINYVMALPHGGRLYFPTGVYNVTSQLTWTLAANVSVTFYGDGSASQLVWAAGGTATMLFVGASAPVFGAQVVFEDIRFSQPYGGTISAVYLKNCNNAVFRNCSFYSYTTGVALESSYNVLFFGSTFYGCSGSGITTSVTGTNCLIVHGCKFSTNGVAVNLLVGGNNIVIRDNDVEGNGYAVGITNYTSVLIEGNYIENGTNVVFYFGGSNYKVDIKQNWLGANSVSTNFGNIVGGALEHNTFYNSTWSSNATDFVIGDNYIVSGATLPKTIWSAPTLQNGFTLQNANYYPAGYLKKPDNTVVLRGDLYPGTVGTVIFNLPAGYRPSLYCTFCTASSAGNGASVVEVRSNGDVVCLSQSGGGTGLNGISFQAEA